MKTFQIAFVSLVLGGALGAVACGGKSKGGAGPAVGGEGDDPATPFNDGAVKATIRSTPGVDECGVEASTTMGAHLAAQKESLKGGPDGSYPVNESFMCRAQANNNWECEWAVMSVSTGEPDPDDPCAGEGGGSGFIIMFTVRNDGAVVPGSIHCNAPG